MCGKEYIDKFHDEIYWIYSSTKNIKNISFHTEPYLPHDKNLIPSKLIYASSQPYGKSTVMHHCDSKSVMYRVAYKFNNKDIRHVSDKEIQDVAYTFGLKRASGIHSNLSSIINSDIDKIVPSSKFLDRFTSNRARHVSNSIAKEYGIKTEEIKLTGGAQINGKSIDEQHDLDVIVPVLSNEHAGLIWKEIKSKVKGHVIERGFISPMRWYSPDSSMICPFFIYDKKMDIPILDMKLGETVNTRVTVSDARLSLFNMPLFKVIGDVDFIAFRSRIARATIVENTQLIISAPLILVTKGDESEQPT
jgi:hypothetical protein